MPLNLLPKIPTLSCIFVLYNSFFVCVLYKRVVCVLYFPSFVKLYFSNFVFFDLKKLKKKLVLLDVSPYMKFVCCISFFYINKL